jgi:GWxTD domain-containing protein
MRKSNYKLCAGALIAALATALPVAAQIELPGNKSNDFLLTDYAYFRSDDSALIRLELYYQIHHRGLAFVLSGGRYTADFELLATVQDRDDKIVHSYTRDRRIVLGADEEARTRVDFRTSQINMDLPPGKYRARFTLKDRTSGQVTTREMDIKLDELYDKDPRLSEIEFAQAFQGQTEESSIFSKRDLLVVPSVHRTYGSQADDRIAYYFELYPGTDELVKVVLETRVRHYRRGLLYRDTIHIALGDQPERQLREISVEDLLPGEYELSISALGRRNKKLASRSQMFKVAWTQDGMIRNDWKATVKQLQLFSDDVDVGDMEKLETIDDRVKAFDQFWRERDPTEGTPENEAKTAFYYRIRMANERFGVMRMEGWRTDRGQIYIRYGEPDYMVNEPFSPDRYPYQIWYYTRISPNRRFVFVDENEDGDYRLQYPYDGLNRTGGY